MTIASSKLCFLISILEVLILVGRCRLVRNGDELETCLCSKKLGDVTLILNHSVNYEVSHNGFCIVNTNGSISIESDSLEITTINCTQQNYTIPNSTFGLAFINTSVVLTRIAFYGCGATLPSIVHQGVNSSLFRFSNVHAATILFMQCTANISNINITNYYGFAFVAVNLQNSSFFKMSVNNNSGINLSGANSLVNSVGSGVLILFSDLDNDRVIQDYNNSIITLFECIFIANSEFIYNKAKLCIPSLFYSLKNAPFTVVNAAALTIIFNQQKIHSVVSIEQTQFLHNFGNLAAAVLILMFNTTKGRTEIRGDSSFNHNINFYPCYGSALVFYTIQDTLLQECSLYSSRIQLLKIINTTIRDHKGAPCVSNPLYGAVYLGVVKPVVAMEFFIQNVTFKRNVAEKSGACILATVYSSPITEVGKVSVTLKSITAYKNSQFGEFSLSNTGIFSFNNIHCVTIHGTILQPSKFSYNYGSVIDAFSSTIYLNGHVIFENNQAKYGAAIRFLESILYFNESLNVTFYNNKAEQLGGAIFGMRTIFSTNPECVLQIPISNNCIMNFVNNSAHIGGNTIHASPIYSCYSITSNKIVKSTNEYLKQFKIANISSNDLLEISSNPYMIKVCENETFEVNHYPGETIHLSMSALDGSGNHVHSVVSLSLANYDDYCNHIKHSTLHVFRYEEYQVLKESHKSDCSLVNVTIADHNSIPSSLNYQEIYILLSPFSHSDVEKIHLRFSNCPIGFTLVQGICQCDNAIVNFSKAFQLSINCDINKLSISLSRYFINPWLGKLNAIDSFGITGDCPFELCKSMMYFQSFVLVDGNYMLANSPNLSEHVPICLSNRNGVLCGTCIDSYSVVFGSRGCYKCSNKSLWTILLYIAAGPLLIYLLYALRLTLTAGNLNGIIFYAQAANGGLIAVMKEYNGTKIVLRQLCQFTISFLSFLNLNLGFPLCFYNGMTELWKTGLSLAFPIYLLIIVVILIVLSRYSTWLSNRISHSSVQVLVTVVHLSFSNLLLTIIYVFVSSVIYTSDKHYRVWYWDGSIEYMGQSHRILVIISLVVTLSLILPYIVFLLIAKSLVRRSSLASNYLRPVFEAIHAPYKEGKHYWFVARLLLLVIIYVVYATVNGKVLYIIIAALLALFLIGQSLFHPFKNKLINLLDSSLMFNLTIIYVSLSYDSLKKSVVFNVIAVFLVFLTFLVIVLYHILWVTGLSIKIRRGVVTSRKWISDHITFYNRSLQQSRARSLQEATDSFYGSCSQYREPILSDSH